MDYSDAAAFFHQGDIIYHGNPDPQTDTDLPSG